MYHTAAKKKAEDEAAAAAGETSQKSVLESLCVVNEVASRLFRISTCSCRQGGGGSR